MTDRILLSKAHVTELEEKLLLEALRSDWVAPAGPMIDEFESKVASRVGVADAVALSSGTAALHLALLQAIADKHGLKIFEGAEDADKRSSFVNAVDD